MTETTWQPGDPIHRRRCIDWDRPIVDLVPEGDISYKGMAWTADENHEPGPWTWLR